MHCLELLLEAEELLAGDLGARTLLVSRGSDLDPRALEENSTHACTNCRTILRSGDDRGCSTPTHLAIDSSVRMSD
eukprot:2106474-Pyramimonas_sp.AAC.1